MILWNPSAWTTKKVEKSSRSAEFGKNLEVVVAQVLAIVVAPNVIYVNLTFRNIMKTI